MFPDSSLIRITCLNSRSIAISSYEYFVSQLSLFLFLLSWLCFDSVWFPFGSCPFQFSYVIPLPSSSCILDSFSYILGCDLVLEVYDHCAHNLFGKSLQWKQLGAILSFEEFFNLWLCTSVITLEDASSHLHKWRFWTWIITCSVQFLNFHILILMLTRRVVLVPWFCVSSSMDSKLDCLWCLRYGLLCCVRILVLFWAGRNYWLTLLWNWCEQVDSSSLPYHIDFVLFSESWLFKLMVLWIMQWRLVSCKTSCW